jgi:hypothetical protein
MNTKTFSYRGRLALLLAAAALAGCSLSSGEAALRAVDSQEKAWESKDPSVANLTAQELIDMYSSIAERFPEEAKTANDRITRVTNLQTLAMR